MYRAILVFNNINKYLPCILDSLSCFTETAGGVRGAITVVLSMITGFSFSESDLSSKLLKHDSFCGNHLGAFGGLGRVSSSASESEVLLYLRIAAVLLFNNSASLKSEVCSESRTFFLAAA